MRVWRRRPGRRSLAAAAAVALLGVGAGVATAWSDSSTGSGDDLTQAPGYYASSPAVCGLVTRADLRAGLGRAFAEGDDPGLTNTFADMPGTTKCRYARAEKEGTPYIEVGVVYAYADEILAAVEKRRKPYQSSKVPGLGEKALWYPEAGELLVKADDKILGVYLPAELFESAPEVRERARRLAARALERL